MIYILRAIEAVLQLPVIPIESDKEGEQVIYSVIPFSDDGVKKVYQLRLNIVANSLQNAEKYDVAIRKALIGTGDTQKVNGVLGAVMSGGGTLKSAAGIHRIVNYIITVRSDVK